jgi:hypothetical protein
MFANAGLFLLRALYSKRPAPLAGLLFLQALCRDKKHLANKTRTLMKRDSLPANRYLAERLQNTPLGSWALDAATINLLEEQVHALKPRLILEFGCGTSTLCFARFMSELYGDTLHEPVIYSIEQDDSFMAQCQEMLAANGLSRFVKMLHAPMTTLEVEGIKCHTYHLNPQILSGFLDDQRPDFCLVDGPSTTTFDGRFATLPLLKEHLKSGAYFYLDDALRPQELQIAREWRQRPYLQVNGIALVGKGMLMGRVK